MTKALDMALFVPANPQAGEVVEIASPGPPLVTQFNTYVGGPPGTTVAASVPAATMTGQTLLAGPGPDFDWLTGTTSSTLPQPTEGGQGFMSDDSPPYAMQLVPAVPGPTGAQQVPWSAGSDPFSWTATDFSAVLTTTGIVTNASGGSFTAGADLAFAPSAALAVRIDGGDAAMSAIDNFDIDCGTF